MREIEIRRTLSAKDVISIQANPAVIARTNGEPDEIVVALEIVTDMGPSEDGGRIHEREVFSLPLAALTSTETTFANAGTMAAILAEDLK